MLCTKFPKTLRFLQPDNYASVKCQRPSIYSVSNNLIKRESMNVGDTMQTQLAFRRHNKTPSFGGSPVNCFNDINQLYSYVDKRHLIEGGIKNSEPLACYP